MGEWGNMSTAPRVIHLVVSLAPGGLERLVVDWTNARNRLLPGSTSICCLDEKGMLAEQVEDADVVCIQAVRLKRPFDISAVRRLRQLLTRKSFSSCRVVHSHNAAAWQYASLACLGTGIRHVHTEHGTNPHYCGMVNRVRTALMRRVTHHLVAVSSTTAEDLSRHHHIPRGQITVIANGVCFGKYAEVRGQNLELRKCLGIPETAFVFGSVGRLAHIKGYDRLISAFAAHGLQVPPPATTPQPDHITTPFLLLVGDGPEREALARQARVQGVSDRVIFAGYQADPGTYLAVMDLFVLPSRSEGLSIALLEAMAAGVPVAVTDVGENRAIVDGGACGIVLPDDELEWKESFLAVTANRDAMASRASMGQTRVRTRFSQEATMEGYEKLYSV